MSENATLKYIHQDSLGGASVMTSSNGTLLGTIKYMPFGGTRSITGAIATDKLFTGLILDDTGLYYYNARYYDATIGRFISPDTVVPNPANPQCFNRYAYCLNNPLRYTDSSGNEVDIEGRDVRNIEKIYNEYDFNTWQQLEKYELFQGYDSLRNLVPIESKKWENSKDITNLEWGPFSGGAITLGGKFPIGEVAQTIYIGKDYQGSQIGLLASIEAHELWHANEG